MRRVTTGGWAVLLCLLTGTAAIADSCLDTDYSYTLQIIDRWGDGLNVLDVAAEGPDDPVWALCDQGMLVSLAVDPAEGFVLQAVLQVDPQADRLAVDGRTVAVGGPGTKLEFFAWDNPQYPQPAGKLTLPAVVEDLAGGAGGIVAACGPAGLVRMALVGGVPTVTGVSAAAVPALAVAAVGPTGRVYAGTGGRELVRFEVDAGGGLVPETSLSVASVPHTIAWTRKPDIWGNVRTELALTLDDGSLRLLRDDFRTIDDLGTVPATAGCVAAAQLPEAVFALGNDGLLSVLSPPPDNALTVSVLSLLDTEPVRGLAVVGDALLLGTAGRGLVLASLPGDAVPPDPSGSIAAGGVAADVDGSRAALVGDRLTVVDLGGAVPEVLGGIDLPELAVDVALGGSLACVAGYSSGLMVFDVSAPAEPVARGQLLFGSPASCVELVGTTALVAEGTRLQAVDVSVPGAPRILTTRAIAAVAQDMVLAGRTLWVADYGLQRYDVSDPAAPVDLDVTTIGGHPLRIAAGGGVLIAMEGLGLTVIDVSDPVLPVVLSYYRMPAYLQARAIGMAGRAVWVGTDHGTVLHLRLDGGVLHGPVFTADAGSQVFRLVPYADRLLGVHWADTLVLPVDCAALRASALSLQLIQDPAAAYLLWPAEAAGGAEVCVFRDGGGDPAAETPLACSGTGFYADLTADQHCYRVAYRDAWGAWSLPSNEVCRKSTPSAVAPVLAMSLAAAPNPFNPITRLRFTLAAPGRAELAVHDLQGRRMAVLQDAELEAGDHEVTWQGRDEAGRNVASGVYVARLVTAGETATVRLTLLR